MKRKTLNERAWAKANGSWDYPKGWLAGHRAGLRDGKAEAKRIIDLAYRMARHIRNSDDSSPVKWGIEGMNLLVELHKINSKAYAKVKRN